MRKCNMYGVGKNIESGSDVVIDLGVRPENSRDDLNTEWVATIQLDKESVKRLIDILTEYVSE